MRLILISIWMHIVTKTSINQGFPKCILRLNLIWLLLSFVVFYSLVWLRLTIPCEASNFELCFDMWGVRFEVVILACKVNLNNPPDYQRLDLSQLTSRLDLSHTVTLITFQHWKSQLGWISNCYIDFSVSMARFWIWWNLDIEFWINVSK